VPMRSAVHPPLTFVGVVVLLAALLPGVATAQIAPAGSLGVDQGRTNASPDAGPVLPGPEYLVTQDVFDTTDRDRQLIADGRGNLLLQGSATVAGDDVERLASFDAATGQLDWVIDDIADNCKPVVTEDGRIFAQYEGTSAGAGSSSFDPVELDAVDGTPVNRYTSPNTDAEPRLVECDGGLALTDDGVLLLVTRAFADVILVGIDTTTTPMTQAFRTPIGSNTAGIDVVLSPVDTAIAHVLTRRDVGEEIRVSVNRVDTTSGAVLDTVDVPGTAGWSSGNLQHTGDLLLAYTANNGGQPDPARVIAMDPDTLDVRWIVSADDFLDEDGDRRFDDGAATVTQSTVVVREGALLLGFALADGKLVWEQRLSSFSNNGNQVIADAAGRVYTSNFGGVPLEVFDGTTGDRIFASPEVDEFLGDGVTGEALALGPIIDGTLFLTLATLEDGSPVLVALGNGQARLDGAGGDVIDVAIQICQYLFGPDGARTVVLSRDDVFADTLAAAPLAGDDSCILFSAGGPNAPIDPRTLAEIDRVLADGGVVRIAGGVNAVSGDAASAIAAAGFVVQRLAGPGRVETAVEIARIVDAERDGDGTAVVAFAGDWPDAATAGAAAAASGSPVLLSGSDALAPQTADALVEFGTRRTFIAGGTAVLGDAVAAAAPGAVRVAGDNRFGTAAEVARQMWTGLASDDAFVFANLEFERGWALALAASPLSVRIGAPQLGVTADRFPGETIDYLTEIGNADRGTFVLGDVSIVSDEVVGQIDVTTR
jgi:putative cell wall-binding protein/outer membrane protein assembly factor BamB